MILTARTYRSGFGAGLRLRLHGYERRIGYLDWRRPCISPTWMNTKTELQQAISELRNGTVIRD